jgi:membrane protein required for colicin V production
LAWLRGALIVMALVFVVREVIPESERSLLAESELMPHVDVLLSWTMRTFEEFKDVEIKGLNA